MESKYEGLTAKEADDVMIGTIDLIVRDATNEARAMTNKE